MANRRIVPGNSASFDLLRQSGAARLPRDPIRARVDRSQLGARARTGSFLDDVQNEILMLPPSEGRDRLNNRGFQTLTQRHLIGSSPNAVEDINQMHRRRMASGMSGGGSNSVLAAPRMRDPMEQWREKAWFFLKEGDFEGTLKKMREWARLIYMTHPLIPSLIDIYSRFPLLDIEFTHHDKKLADFYNQLFLDELNYQDFLFDMAREHWTVGEAFALGSWHDGIGAWDADELINPDDVVVSHNSVLRQYQYHLRVPEGIKKLIETRQPREEYEQLVRFYPYVIQWAQNNKEIPVSDILMKHLKFKVNPWEPHGVPILMRAFKTLMLEMSLESAQDAVADRLYSPLILAKLGIEDVGDGEGPWIPEPSEIDSLRDDLALSLMSDFRLMVYHHGLNIESVFGREVMPRFFEDFERVDMKLMQIFGIGPELLQGGNSSAPYASGALNRELLTQMLTTYQVSVEQFLRDRMSVVAERQGHYEFEKRGQMRVPVYERVLLQNEETGEEYVEERPKLAVPKVKFRTMNLRDEAVERQFLLELKAAGVPISDDALMVNIPFEFDEQIESMQREKLEKELAELHYQKRLFTAMFLNQLPVPMEYAMAYQQWLMGMQGMASGMPGQDITAPPPAPNLFMPGVPGMIGPGMGGAPGAPMGQMGQGGQMMGGMSPVPDQRPPESDSMRKSTPKKSSVEEPEEPEVFQVDYSQVDYEGIKSLLLKEGSVAPPVEEEDETPGYEWVGPKEQAEVMEPIRVADIHTLASPEHMRMRRKMAVPITASLKPYVEPVEQLELELETFESELPSENGTDSDEKE